MSRVEEFHNKKRTIKSQMPHQWDKLLIVDLNKVGLWPNLKNQNAVVTYKNCNKDILAALIFERLCQEEPLFKETTEFFREKFNASCSYCFCNPVFTKRHQENEFLLNWTEFFDSFYKDLILEGSIPWEDLADLRLWKKIDLSDTIDQAYRNNLGENYKEEFEKILQEEDPLFFAKIVRYKNSVNPKAS